MIEVINVLPICRSDKTLWGLTSSVIFWLKLKNSDFFEKNGVICDVIGYDVIGKLEVGHVNDNFIILDLHKDLYWKLWRHHFLRHWLWRHRNYRSILFPWDRRKNDFTYWISFHRVQEVRFINIDFCKDSSKCFKKMFWKIFQNFLWFLVQRKQP